jgi:hypothetical protein
MSKSKPEHKAKTKSKPIKVTFLTPNEQKERASQIKQNQAEYEKGRKRHEKYLSQLPPATAKEQADRFLEKVREIRQYLYSIQYQENFEGSYQKWDLYRQFVKIVVNNSKTYLKNCPDFGEFPRLINRDHVAALQRLMEYCERAAELLEASGNSQLVVLTENQLKILKYLNEVHVIVAQVDIAQAIDKSEKTVRTELRGLKNLSYVSAPKEGKNRVGITQQGMDHLESIQKITS